jgi:hypothetical protein
LWYELNEYSIDFHEVQYLYVEEEVTFNALDLALILEAELHPKIYDSNQIIAATFARRVLCH